MKYKSQATNSPVIFVLVILVLLPVFFDGALFSIAKVFIPLTFAVLLLLILASHLQWYEIKDDRITGRQVTKIDIPFSSIDHVSVMNQTSNLRVRRFSGRGLKSGFRLGKEIFASSVSSDIPSVSSALNEFNKENTVAKLKLPLSSAVLFIYTKTGEARILPKDSSRFLEELRTKFKISQGKELSVEMYAVNT